MKHLVLKSFLLVFWAVNLMTAHAQDANSVTVTGKVLESPMATPINAASIRVLNAADSSFVAGAISDGGIWHNYGTSYATKEYTGEFSLNLPRGKYIFSVSCLGFRTVFKNVDLTGLDRREFTYALSTVYLVADSRLLDEVTVTASKVKFYHKGDTLVYNADAFLLAEGSMLDALIQQMPGVEIKDNGNIYVYGRFVEELLLNGRQFFDNNRQLMLENIAAYTVKDIQVYDKAGRASELAGADLGDSEYVMDVKLKKEFMMGTAVNAEAGYGSEDRYLGRLFAMGFTPTGQYAAYFNINNLNESRKPGQESSWTPETMPTGVRKTLSGGFDYNVKTLNNRWEVNGNVNAQTTRETDGTDIVRNNYLVSGSTFDYEFNRQRNKSLQLGTNHKIYYKTPKGYGIAAEPFFNYRKWENYSEDVNATLSEAFNDVSTDFIENIYQGNNTAALAALVNRNLSSDFRKGHSIATGTNLWQGIRIPDSNDLLVINLVGKYNNRHDERFNHYEINYGQESTPAETANRYFRNHPDFDSYLAAEANYTRSLTSFMNVSLNYRYEHIYAKATSDLYGIEGIESVEDFMLGKLPSAIDYETALDANNSYLSRTTENNHKIKLTFYYNKNGLWIQYNLPMTFANRELHYQRGAVDTTFTHRSVVFDISNAFIRKTFGKNMSLFWDVNLKSRTPDLVSMVNFTDDTNPLYITKGNSDLKNALIFDTSLMFNRRLREKGRGFYSALHYTITSNALSQGYTYDTETGIREGSYYNVNGNWALDGSFRYYWNKTWGDIGNEIRGGHTTNVDLVGQDSPTLFRSKVYNLNFSDLFFVNYRFAKHNIGLDVNPRYDRFTSNRTDFEKQDTWTVKSSLKAVFELPANFQLATDFTVYNRRGYTDEALNTDNFVWNARLTYRALKGKLLLMLDGYDILHDLSNVSYTINAQARTEVYRTVLPRYVMFHVQWRFNRQPKK